MKKTILKIFNLQDSCLFLRGYDVFEEEVILQIRESNHAECPRCDKTTRRRHARGVNFNIILTHNSHIKLPDLSHSLNGIRLSL